MRTTTMVNKMVKLKWKLTCKSYKKHLKADVNGKKIVCTVYRNTYKQKRKMNRIPDKNKIAYSPWPSWCRVYDDDKYKSICMKHAKRLKENFLSG
jgi:thiaminase